jgi:hypothetical protein
MSQQLYYIRNLERESRGNLVVWWKPNHQGYTTDLEQAGFYTQQQAEEITKAANIIKTEDVMVPVEEARAVASMSVDKDSLQFGYKP